jgi:hypothetical protein
MFTDMATLLAALASPTFPNGYDSDDPQYVYKDNGDGTLFCVGLAAPSDFQPDGTIQGPQPTQTQNEMARKHLQRTFHNPILDSPVLATALRPSLPEHTLATQDETRLLVLHPPTRDSRHRDTVMGSLPRLPTEGAKTDNE